MPPRSSSCAWPDNHARPELLDIRGAALRTFSLLLLFFLWVFGLGTYASLGVYTLYALAVRAVAVAWFGDAFEPLPTVVQGFLGFLVFYWSYHAVVPAKWHEWPWLRVTARWLNMEYPYFRFNACVFEELDSEGEEENDQALAKPTRVPKADAQSLFAFHPHGVLTCGMTVNGVHHERFADAECTWLVAENLFWFPILRDVLHWTCFNDVHKSTMVNLMRKGTNVSIIPGGFEEATLYQRGSHRVFLKNRFGFIKLALQHGYKIYPAYTFGEEYLYHTFPYLLRWRMMLNELKVPGVAFFGRLECFFLPQDDVDVITVVGKPLEMPTIAHPTREDIAKFHAQYVSSLQKLFDKYKKKYAVNPDAKLEIF